MKANSDKSHLPLRCDGPSAALVDSFSIEPNITEIVLENTIDRELKFDDHVKKFSKKVYKNLNTIASVAPF